MKEYVICVFAASLLSGAVSMIASGTSYEKYIKYICSLLCVAVIVSPFAKLSFDIPDISEPEASYVPSLAENAAAITEAKVEAMIFEEFGISGARVCIDLYSDEDGVVINGVTVTLPSGSDADAVSKYLTEALGGKVYAGCEENPR